MGGVGKTQLAVQFAWTYGHRFAGVHWVSAYRPEKSDLPIDKITEESIARCGQEMNLHPWPQNVARKNYPVERSNRPAEAADLSAKCARLAGRSGRLPRLRTDWAACAGNARAG